MRRGRGALALSFLSFLLFLTAGCQESAGQQAGASEEKAVDAVAETVDLTIITHDGTPRVFHVETALTPQEQSLGLMYRQEMAEDAGMLFVFSEARERSFWMRNTMIPLDIVYIRGDGTIHKIHENAVPLDETSIPSDGSVSRALEINGGMAARLGIRSGDRVYNKEYFGNTLAP
ncbi:MAG: DUF192 domain-containing protein [Proteobacteria bacterium]|nr:DUF192 domain-containing protein [Pseudomonadota bacterium]